jgi:5-hydroxyisourate hydrolase
MGRLTTHVLDTARGMPAAGMRIRLLRGAGSQAVQLKTFLANADGRTEAPLLEGNEMIADTWQIVFHVGEYFRGMGHPDAGRFLNEVPIVFVIDEPGARYHVPLLVSPWSYSTYKGS